MQCQFALNNHVVNTSHTCQLHITVMAEKQDDGPPPLEDPNSWDYECVICHNKVNSQCLSCLQKSLQMTSFGRIYKYIPLPDSELTDDVCEICANKVKTYCHGCMETSQLRSKDIRNARDDSDTSAPQPMPDTDRSDSAVDVDVICDSSTSSDTNLDIDFVENLDGSGLYLRMLTERRLAWESYMLRRRLERDSDTKKETDDTDMPPLEKMKITKIDSAER